MPVYEFECTSAECNHKFSVLYQAKYIDGVVVTSDPEHQYCPKCDEHAEQLYSLTVMRPDSHWNGVYFETTDYYSTSKAKYDRWCKHHWENDMERSFIEIGDRTDREGLAKMCREAEVSKDKKREKILEDFLIEEYAGVDLDQGDGQSHVITRSKLRKEQERREMESAHPMDVFEDPAFK